MWITFRTKRRSLEIFLFLQSLHVNGFGVWFWIQSLLPPPPHSSQWLDFYLSSETKDVGINSPALEGSPNYICPSLHETLSNNDRIFGHRETFEKWKWKLLSRVRLFATQWTIRPWNSQARVLEWVAFPSPGDLPNPAFEPWSPAWRGRILYQLSHQGSPRILEWVAYPFSRGFSQPRNWTGVSWLESYQGSPRETFGIIKLTLSKFKKKKIGTNGWVPLWGKCFNLLRNEPEGFGRWNVSRRKIRVKCLRFPPTPHHPWVYIRHPVHHPWVWVQRTPHEVTAWLWCSSLSFEHGGAHWLATPSPRRTPWRIVSSLHCLSRGRSWPHASLEHLTCGQYNWWAKS